VDGPDLHDFAARAPSAGLGHSLQDSTARSGTLRGDDLDPSGRPALSSRHEVTPDMRILLFDGVTTLQALAPGEVLLRPLAQEDRRCD
jgi:hypothetical protein